MDSTVVQRVFDYYILMCLLHIIDNNLILKHILIRLFSYFCEVAPSNVQFFKNRLLHSKNFVDNFMKLLRP